jgi:hypothetical protein
MAVQQSRRTARRILVLYGVLDGLYTYSIEEVRVGVDRLGKAVGAVLTNHLEIVVGIRRTRLLVVERLEVPRL